MSVPQPGACSHQSGRQGQREPAQSALPVMHSLTVITSLSNWYMQISLRFKHKAGRMPCIACTLQYVAGYVVACLGIVVFSRKEFQGVAQQQQQQQHFQHSKHASAFTTNM